MLGTGCLRPRTHRSSALTIPAYTSVLSLLALLVQSTNTDAEGAAANFGGDRVEKLVKVGGAYVEGASPLFINKIKAPSSICVSSDSKLMGVCGSGDFTTRFTCFTGTKVPILTPEELRASGRDRSGAM
jgi:hypothetical protein